MLDTLAPPSANDIDIGALGTMVEAVASDPGKAQTAFRVTTRWLGQTRSEAIVEGFELGGDQIARSHRILADEPHELLGQDSAPNPQELLMAALNACMTVGYVAGASLHGIRLESLEIETRGELDLRGFLGLDDSVPPGYTDIEYEVRIKGDGTDEQFADIHRMVIATSPNYFNLARPIRMNARLTVA